MLTLVSVKKRWSAKPVVEVKPLLVPWGCWAYCRWRRRPRQESRSHPSPVSIVLRRQSIVVVGIACAGNEAFELGGQLLVELQ